MRGLDQLPAIAQRESVCGSGVEWWAVSGKHLHSLYRIKRHTALSHLLIARRWWEWEAASRSRFVIAPSLL